MKVNKAINFLSLPAAILTYLGATITPLASHPVEKWSRDYTCGQYNITVSEEPHGVFNYQSRSARGNLNLKGGTIEHTKNQKLFQFHNNDFEYLIWTNLENHAGVLEVYQNKRKILEQDCLPDGLKPIPLNLQYPTSGIIVQGSIDITYSIRLKKGMRIHIIPSGFGARARLFLSDPDRKSLGSISDFGRHTGEGDIPIKEYDMPIESNKKCYYYEADKTGNYYISAYGGPTYHSYSFLIAIDTENNFCNS